MRVQKMQICRSLQSRITVKLVFHISEVDSERITQYKTTSFQIFWVICFTQRNRYLKLYLLHCLQILYSPADKGTKVMKALPFSRDSSTLAFTCTLGLTNAFSDVGCVQISCWLLPTRFFKILTLSKNVIFQANLYRNQSSC